jgi:hypothetical protein
VTPEKGKEILLAKPARRHKPGVLRGRHVHADRAESRQEVEALQGPRIAILRSVELERFEERLIRS